MFYGLLYGIRGRGRTMRETETVGTVHSQNYRHCTKRRILRLRAFFQTLAFFYFQIMKISVRNSDHTLMLLQINDTKMSKFKVIPRIHCLLRCCYIN